MLIPKLDSEDGEGEFKLLVHHRDFDIGTQITENIVRGIQESRKIVLILSRHFVDSNWCDFELQMASMRCFDEGKELVVAVLMDENVLAMKMSGTLRALLKRDTYLKWSEDPDESTKFWISLKNSLGAAPD